jgi:hypothetical protein
VYPDGEYGFALGVGDFQGDGYDDLVVGTPGSGNFRGNVDVHYGLHGSLGSIQWVAEHSFSQGSPGAPGSPDGHESFGHSLAAGDFDGDGRADLAIGAPRDSGTNISDGAKPGNVMVTHGHTGGLSPVVAFEMELGLDGLPDAPEHEEEFGFALASGDFDGDGFDDLAISVPAEDDVGAVLVVYGSPFSLLFANHWYFGLIDLGATPQAGSRFGHSLGSGDFNGDGYDDLAVGAPDYDGAGGAQPDSGLVAIVYGSGSGLSPAGAHFFWEDIVGSGGTSEPGDKFGSSLAAGDFDGDGVDDLAIGAVREGFSDCLNAGAVTVRSGVAGQGAIGPARLLHNKSYPLGMIPPRLGGLCEVGWGAALATGDFDGNGFSDLAVGAPWSDTPPATLDTGSVAVVYGQLFVDGFETGDALEWSGVAP